jgi:hypothetical protein
MNTENKETSVSSFVQRDLVTDFEIQTSWIGFEILTAVGTKMAVFWVVAPCSLVGYQRFRGPCCLHHQGDEDL